MEIKSGHKRKLESDLHMSIVCKNLTSLLFSKGELRLVAISSYEDSSGASYHGMGWDYH